MRCAIHAPNLEAEAPASLNEFLKRLASQAGRQSSCELQ